MVNYGSFYNLMVITKSKILIIFSLLHYLMVKDFVKEYLFLRNKGYKYQLN